MILSLALSIIAMYALFFALIRALLDLLMVAIRVAPHVHIISIPLHLVKLLDTPLWVAKMFSTMSMEAPFMALVKALFMMAISVAPHLAPLQILSKRIHRVKPLDASLSCHKGLHLSSKREESMKHPFSCRFNSSYYNSYESCVVSSCCTACGNTTYCHCNLWQSSESETDIKRPHP